MAGKDDDFGSIGFGVDDDDDATPISLRDDIEKLLSAGDDGDDNAGMGPLSDDEGREAISAEKATELARQAALERDRKKPILLGEQQEQGEEAKADDEGQAAKPEDVKAESGQKPEDAIKASSVDALIDGLPDDRRAEIGRRLGDADQIVGLFKGREAEMERHGVTPPQAMARMLELNAFAQTNPDEYLAWVAVEMNAKAPHEILSKAAERLGFKMVPATEKNDDLFEDEEVKRLREEVRQLKGETSYDFGPDTEARKVERKVQQDLQDFIGARDPATGQPLRPYFNILRDRIAQMAGERRTQTGQPVTTEDLHAIYVQADAEARTAFGGNSAAQSAPTVAQQDQKAASIEKAKLASKNIDGSGQGAARRPALPDDAPISDVIRHFMNAQKEG